MSSSISYKDDCLWISNMGFRTVFDFAIEVGRKTVCSPEQINFVDELERQSEEVFYSGIHVDLAEQFPDLAEKKFWCRVFFDTARAVFMREIGNQEIDFWQTDKIYLLQYVARMLLKAVEDAMNARWSPTTKDGMMSNRYHRDR